MRIARTSWRVLRALLTGFAILILIVMFTPLVRLMTLQMEQPWYDGNGEVLIVLGGSMLIPGAGPGATLGQDTYLRCVYASWILKQQRFTHVLVTGGDGAAEAMARFLEQNGVDERIILKENRANSTYENALYSKRLLEKEYGAGRLPPVVLLTSDFHSWRARRVFTHLGFQARTIPVPDLIKQSAFISQRWSAFLTLLTELAKDAYYLGHERI
jgi:uncharacterized SAM-binding protein YcdF (DUF218 family)